MMNITVRG